MQEQQKLERLLGLLIEGSISREDYENLINAIRDEAGNGDLDKAADNMLSSVKARHLLGDAEREQLFKRITSDVRFKVPLEDEVIIRAPFYRRYAVAAMLVCCSAVGFYFYSVPGKPAVTTVAEKVTPVPVITPGDDKAVLTLGDGRKIILDSAENGELAKQAGVSIHKTSEGQIMYSFSGETNETSAGSKVAYNTVETPAGGKYQVNLPDGSKVWLNSSSSLRFPAMFTGNTREVELSGEAFFDVSTNKNRPFKVTSKDQVVEVLGTQFNINSYADEEEVKTTLIEGSVKVHYKDKVVMLNPGQQFQSKAGRIAKATPADTEEVIAWKNGYFLFKNENIHSVMRKISRWYDVEVIYSGEIPSVGFGGNISRSKDIDEVLAVLQLTNVVKFKIEGRRITVMP